MEHYILIKVRERDPERPTPSDMGRLRKVIHTAVTDLGLEVIDIPIRGDREHTYYGARNPLPEAVALFELAMPA